jgi:hypothetical protein
VNAFLRMVRGGKVKDSYRQADKDLMSKWIINLKEEILIP